MSYVQMNEDAFLARDLANDLRATVADLSLERRNLILLMVSAGLTEAAAYDLAPAEPPESTAALILAAAEIDRHVDRQRRRASERSLP